jgi:hypothetical protein
MPIELAPKGHAAHQLYRIKPDARWNAGKLVRLRTNNKWALMDYATGTEWADPIKHVEEADFVCSVCINPKSGIEVYFVPADRVAADLKASHKAFIERRGRPSNSDVRILKFNNDPTRPWHGYGEKYAQFKLGRMPSPPASPPRLSMLGGDVIERAQRMVADKFGVPVSAVRISVDFPPHGQDPVASDMALAAAEYDRIQRARDVYEETVREYEQAELQRKQVEADRSASDKAPGFTSELEEIHAAEDFIEQIEQARQKVRST